MCNTNELKERETYLLEAFNDSDFADELKQVRISIEEDLKMFVTHLKKRLSEEHKIYENIESRIKSKDSFKEKLYRKDYIKTWNVTKDIKENQQMISKCLPDLLGFRINCFFWQDEEIIYNILKEYYDQKNFTNFTLNFSENKIQKNGHTIYKLSGIFKEKYCFELQIKAIMHNIWGEVEHKTIYKNKNYDADISNKIAITEEVFNILQASDKQLVTLFKKKNSEKHLIYALFYEKTKEIVAQKCGTDILAAHYNGYFQIFSDSDNIQYIKKYVAFSLLETDFSKIEGNWNNPDQKAVQLKVLITSEFLDYNLKCLFYICELIYDLSTFETFMLFLSKYLLEKYGAQDESRDETDAFGDSDEPDMDYIENILTMLDDKIGGRKKNG